MVTDTELVEPLLALIRHAGQEVLALYEQHREETLPVHRKGDDTPVTAADRRSHEVLRDGLAALPMRWPILSEEGHQADWSQRRAWRDFWLVDPVDGTREFINHTGEFCICIALVRGGYPQLGLIHAPVNGDTWIGGVEVSARHVDATDNTRVLRVTARREQPAVVVTSSGGAKREDVRRWTATLARNWPGGVETRELGSALKFCHLAAGDAQAYPRFGAIGEWDSAAGQAILEAAGGLVLNRKGQRLAYNRGKSLLHRHLVAVADPVILQAAGFEPPAAADS